MADEPPLGGPPEGAKGAVDVVEPTQPQHAHARRVAEAAEFLAGLRELLSHR